MPTHFYCNDCGSPVFIPSNKSPSSLRCPNCACPPSQRRMALDDPNPWWIGARTAAPPGRDMDWGVASSVTTAASLSSVPSSEEPDPSLTIPRWSLLAAVAIVGIVACLLALLALPRCTPTGQPGRHPSATKRIQPGERLQSTSAPPVSPRPAPVRLSPAPRHFVRVPTTPEKVVVKRRIDVGKDGLRKQLLKVPELALDRSSLRRESEEMAWAGFQAVGSGKEVETTVALMEKRSDLADLPWREGPDCKLGSTAAGHLQDDSLLLRMFLKGARAGADPGAPTTLPDAESLANQLNRAGAYNRWRKAEAIPALQQLLAVEHEGVREVLLDQLARIDGPEASRVLANRALFDLDARARERAVKALARRPAGEYIARLLAGFEYPWPPVADHAAEAIAALKRTELIPVLQTLLDKPDPQAPHKDSKKGMVVKEMIRVNHLRNCLMCHALSTAPEDKVRGWVPPTWLPLQESVPTDYPAGKVPIFVRADVTYLRQDFSAALPVEQPGVWPKEQQFDFLVRERPANRDDFVAAGAINPKKPSARQRSVLFALRELTGADPGVTGEDWERFLRGRRSERRG
jgi:hypothetical protein